MPYPFVDMIMYFFIYSFCGWLMETVFCSFKERRFINRGFLNGSICPIYGCGVLLMLIFLIPLSKNITELVIALPLVFLTGTILASTVEYSTSWVMEKLFCARWWDYSHIKYNLNGRICLRISLIWGILATLFLYLVQPSFEQLVAVTYNVNHTLPLTIAIILITLLTADIAVSVNVAKRIGNKLEQLDNWAELIREYMDSLELPTKEAVINKLEHVYNRYTPHSAHFRSKRVNEREYTITEWIALPFETVRRKLMDCVEELGTKREALMSGVHPLQKRMLKAFPHMKHPDRPTSLHDLQKHLKIYRSQKKSENSINEIQKNDKV